MNTQRTFHEVPVIDVSALVAADPAPEALDETVRRIGDACRDVGFLYVKNHGLPDGLSERMMEQTRAFFDLPLAEKMKLRLGQTSQFRGYVPMLAGTPKPSPRRRALARAGIHSTTRTSGRRRCPSSGP
jgi:isopenicillin N synthase-like dioxygenase